MTAFYNENNPFAVNELRRLISEQKIAPGRVDNRSIKELTANDLNGYTQCHFFAGIGGWPYALRLAGWPDHRPVWSGSCPCQPFSEAGHGIGFADERHLWPVLFRLIAQRRPPVVFGEQVRNAKVWLDLCLSDLESEGYACGAALLPACGVGARHRRDRFWFVADTASAGSHAAPPPGVHQRKTSTRARDGEPERVRKLRTSRLVADTDRQPPVGLTIPRQERDSWSPEPTVGRVVDGIPHELVKPHLQALGNAIVPQVAAAFISAYVEIGRQQE